MGCLTVTTGCVCVCVILGVFGGLLFNNQLLSNKSGLSRGEGAVVVGL